ncbi:uncharacterized protein LOC62_03G004947 [Vanrija pseudolonga]|uniref:Uncharacterized protein n=1 Tax=Vanrija pseudolonga TaxID=143232 RepID=A0AAF0YAY9_9TREE|nr:hypothetical protein LOC62_03G004947 [Vanrija pseudolonga]
MPPRKKTAASSARGAAAAATAAKKASKAAQSRTKQPPAPTYRVIYRFRDAYEDEHNDYTVGRYASPADARAKVRSYLSDEFGDDAGREELDESDKGDVSGGFEVHAIDSESNEYWVFMEEDAPLVGALEGPRTRREVRPEKVYAVVQRRGTGEKRVDDRVYDSREAAEAAVQLVPGVRGSAVDVVELEVVYG